MVFVHYDDDDACEIKLTRRASASIDLDCHVSVPRREAMLPSRATDYRDYQAESSLSLRSTETDYRTAPSMEYAYSEDVSSFLTELGDPKDCRKLTLVRQGSRYPSSFEAYYVRNSFPVTTLTYVLQEAKNMVCLELCRIRLVGSNEEFEAFARAIESLSLQAFSMEHCRINKRAAQQSALEPVVRALACCTSICDVTLIADRPESLGTLSVETVGFLGRSPSLIILRLEKLRLEDPHIAELSQALETNRMLQTLRLSCAVSDLGSCALVQMIGSNSSMQTFDLYLEKVHNEESTLRIAGALQASAYLKHYGLDFGSQNLSSRLLQVQDEVIATKKLAKELEFSSTSLSNCPFIRLVNGAVDASLYFGRLACFGSTHMVSDQ